MYDLPKIEIEEIQFGESAAGKQFAELQKLRDEFNNYHAEEAAYHAAEATRQKIAERRGFIFGSISTIVCGIVVAIFAYFWPTIVSIIVH